MPDEREHEAELADFLAVLVPGEPLRFDDEGRRRQAVVRRLAPRPLGATHEATAVRLGRAVARTASASGMSGWWHRRAVRRIGERLGAEGGAVLMVLVAHRAQYAFDPDWREKQESRRARARDLFGANAVFMSSDGPTVRLIEHAWHGLYGWQH